MLEELLNDVNNAGNEQDAVSKKRYFKNIVDDMFLGVSNPDVQKIFKKYEKHLNLTVFETLLKSPIHEVRYGALFFLAKRFEKTKNVFDKKEIVSLYLANTAHINNWDLVDCSCYKILGPWAELNPGDQILENLIESSDIWEKRMAMVSCLHFIKKGNFSKTLIFAEKLLGHKHDLIQKAMGWMLKEAWSRGGDEEVEAFLEEHKNNMSRTALRYAIEKMEESKRKKYQIKT